MSFNCHICDKHMTAKDAENIYICKACAGRNFIDEIEKLKEENKKLRKAARTVLKYMHMYLDEDEWVYTGMSYLEKLMKELERGE